MSRTEHCCFMRSNTAEGCCSFLPEFCPPGEGWRTIYIKSGGGGASAALLAAVEAFAGEETAQAEVVWDSPGRERRCALRLPSRKLCLLDAGEPYALEAKLPGAGEELLSLDACRDNAQLRQKREELLRLHAMWQRELLRSARFLRAARAMKRDMAFIAGETLDMPKLERYAARFAARRLPAPNGSVGRESRRFLTSVTGQGLLLRRSGLNEEYSEAMVLEDEYGVAAPLLWNLVRGYALGNGQNVIVCPCLLQPSGEPEHLLLPAQHLACVTANRRHPVEFDQVQRIQAARFYQKEALAQHRCRLRFCRRTMRELLAEAYQAQAAAEQARGSLDEAYAAALLPGALEDMARWVLEGGASPFS